MSRLVYLLLLFYATHSSSADDTRQQVTLSRLPRQTASCNSRSQNVTSPYKFSASECCDERLEFIIRNAVQVFERIPRLGDAARHIQRLIQKTIGKSAEVIVSRQNFAISTYYHGMTSCKLRLGDFFLAAYETPTQYDILDAKHEDQLAALDAQEPLGSVLPPNIKQHFPTSRTLTSDRQACSKRQSTRSSYSFASDECCDGQLDNIIRSESHRISSFPRLDDGVKHLQKVLQKSLKKSFEVIVSKQNLAVSTHYHGSSTCRLTLDGLVVVVYATPTQYDTSVDDEKLVDGNTGSCDKRQLTDGSMAYGFVDDECCDAKLENIIRTEGGKLSSTAHTESTLRRQAKRLQLLVQESLHQSFEVIISRQNFAISTYYHGLTSCKLHVKDHFIAIYATPIQYDLKKKHSGHGLLKDSPKDRCGHRISGDSDPSVPHQSEESECCDERLENIMRGAFRAATNTPKLGDGAKYIQRLIQQSLRQSIEVIVSKENFALSSYYHGLTFCKIQINDYHLAAYATPQQFDPFNLMVEDWLSSVDSQEPLGSTLPRGIRGNFPNVKFNVHAGEDISVQPSIRTARAAKSFEELKPTLTTLPAPHRHFFSENSTGGLVSSFNNRPSVLMQLAAINDTDTDLSGLNPLKLFRQEEAETKSLLPPNTHCDPDRMDGSKCCSPLLYRTMQEAMYELSASPQFGTFDSLSAVTNIIKKRVQQRFVHTFEVLASLSDFAILTYAYGDSICKFTDESGMTVMAYETPRQSIYDPEYLALEDHFSSISRVERLGGTTSELPGSRGFHTELSTETTGERAGFPEGSHCSADERLGSRCCSVPMFQAMRNAYNNLIVQPNFNPFDKQRISTTIRDAVEDAIGLPMETIVANDDFTFASHNMDELQCKYRVDKYYIMTYATPAGGYGLHDDQFADNGPGSPFQCPESLDALQGVACCDGAIQYEMVKAVERLRRRPNFNKYDTDAIGRAIARGVQERFNVTFETIVSRGDFTWNTNKFGEQTCKLDVSGYHALTYSSSPNPPPPGEFAEPIVIVPPIPIPAAAPPVAAGGGASASVAVAASAAGAGAGGACFSTDTWVVTPNGKKRMDMLEIGDHVRTANLTHAYFAPITMWMHREPEIYEMFTTLMTEYGKMLALTPKHLVFRNKCDEWYEDYIETLPPNSEAVFADELEVGDCMILWYKGKWRQQRLMEIEMTKRKGIFAPLTSNGRILVNDILASCYSDVKEATLQTTFFGVVSTIRDYVNYFIGSVGGSVVELPFFTNVTKELLSIVLPYVQF